MASVTPHQSPWFHSINNNNNVFSSSLTKPAYRNFTFFSTVKASSSSLEPEKPSNEPPGQKPDLVKLAFERAKAYKKTVQKPVPKVVEKEPDGLASSKGDGLASGAKSESPPLEAENGGNKEVPASVKLAMEKAKEYKKNKGIAKNDKGVEKSPTISGMEDQVQKTSQKSLYERMTDKKEKEKVAVSSIDFVGLGFADKKINRGLPAGLVPTSEPYPDGDIPEVEMLVGDSTRFGNDTETKVKLVEEEYSETYKPKVSTWGVFPRPSNISKTFGGGRVIRPGEQLETVEDKAAKQKRTREFIAAYRKRTGLNIDPKLKLECEKALAEGDSLMDCGKLKEALPFYQEVVSKLPFKSELHGLAALQWSICQDSLNKAKEARVMYEKLQSHPTVQVRKKAKQFMFGFTAMEMMKVKSTSGSATNIGYQNYFEAFLDKKDNYSLKDTQVEEQEEGPLGQAIPYIVFLVSPIFFVLLIAIRKG